MCFKGNAEEGVFCSSTPALDSVCWTASASLHCPDPALYPSAPISVIFRGQNEVRPTCFPAVESSASSCGDLRVWTIFIFCCYHELHR